MGASVYTKRLVGGVSIATGGTFTVLATVPTGKVWVLRCITLVNRQSSPSGLYTIRVGNAAANAFWAGTVPAFSTIVVDLRVALTAGEDVRANLGSGTVPMQITGYEFTVQRATVDVVGGRQFGETCYKGTYDL